MLIHEFLNKDPYIVPQEATLIILDSKFTVCMAKYDKDIKHKRHISIRVNFVRNCEKNLMYKIDWCEVGLKFVYIATKNVGENNLNPRVKYIMARLDN